MDARTGSCDHMPAHTHQLSHVKAHANSQGTGKTITVLALILKTFWRSRQKKRVLKRAPTTLTPTICEYVDLEPSSATLIVVPDHLIGAASLRLSLSLSTCVCVCVYIYIYICMYTCVCVCVCVCIYISLSFSLCM